MLGAGVLEEVRVQRDKGFGFVRYSTHAEAALAIQMGNNQSIIFGKPIKVYLAFTWKSCFAILIFSIQILVGKCLSFYASCWN